jgi:hypothetical protein
MTIESICLTCHLPRRKLKRKSENVCQCDQ